MHDEFRVVLDKTGSYLLAQGHNGPRLGCIRVGARARFGH